MLRSCALTLSLIVLAAPALAGNPQRATVRINTGRSITTGTVIHQSPEHGTFILTCRHGYQGSEAFHFEVGGRRLAGESRIASLDGDLALMWRPGTGLTSAIAPVADQDVAEGEECTSIGFDQAIGKNKFSKQGSSIATSWTSATSRITSITRGEGTGLGRKISMSIETATFKRGGPGRSGGGLFNAQGDLVGVCSQDRFEGCVFVSHSAIVRFLNRCHAKGLIKWWTPRDAFDDRAVQDLVDFHIGWGKNFRLEGRTEESIESYTAALALVPELSEAHYGRGLAHLQNGHRELALADFQLALKGSHQAAAQAQIAELTSQLAAR